MFSAKDQTVNSWFSTSLLRLRAALSGDRSRQLVTCTAAVSAVLLPTVWGPRFDREDAPPDVITPAPYTFAVWFGIFASALGYAGYQARGSVQDRALFRRVGWPLAGALAATAVWAPLVRTQRYWAAQGALAAIALGAEAARRRTARVESEEQLTGAEVLALSPLTGMLAAWGLAATGVNLGAMLVSDGIVSPGAPAARAGVTILSVLGAAGTIATLGSGGPTTTTARVYAGTLLWALTGVVVGQRRRSVSAAVTAAGAAVPLVAALARPKRRS